MVIEKLQQRLRKNTSEFAAAQVCCVQLEEQVVPHQQYQPLIVGRAEQMAAAYKGDKEIWQAVEEMSELVVTEREAVLGDSWKLMLPG